MDFFSVLSHYEAMIVAQAPDFERQYAPNMRPGFGHDILFPSIFTEPALLAAAILLSTGHLIATRRVPRLHQDAYDALRLQQYVYNDINTALRYPERATSDQSIAAVLLLATYEALHGQMDLYHLHMTGLVQMVNARGGLSGLGMNGYLELFILWQDGNFANAIGGCGYSHLAQSPSTLPKARADNSMFLLRPAEDDA
ncbi:hypothetical protein LTR85_002979 [Meristemomyces frigidus]|nr:hypothetical protein LTR85_002979 [Meristemomyces frigidus]